MSYIPLARKYRPSQFSELLGQEATVKSLSNAINLNRQPQAAIFTGVRGVGKTTLARLYAKALNCERGMTVKPCDVCSSCIAIRDGYHEDVLEIDGASNTGIDDVRELQETLSYTPQRSQFRIFIIDEVHMLSQSAFNALLKTLEELPDYVVFLFATTELIKVPATILSRCQTFYLQCLSLEAIKGRIAQVLDLEKIPYESEALRLIALQGHGSMRDALTFLDQVIAISGENVTLLALKGLISHADTTELLEFLECLLAKNASKLVELVSLWEKAGLVFSDIIEQCAINCRHAFIVRDLGLQALEVDRLVLEPEYKKRLEKIVKNCELLELNRLFRVLVQCRRELDGSALDRFVVENFLLEWCFDPGLPSLEAIIKGSDQRQVTHTSHSQGSLSTKSGLIPKKIKANEEPVSEVRATRSPHATSFDQPKDQGFPASWKQLVEAWKSKKPLEARMLEECFIVKFHRKQIVVSVKPGSMVAGKLMQPDVTRLLAKQLRELFSFEGEFRVISRESDDQEENLLAARVREQDENNAKIRGSSLTEPRTLDAVEIFKGKVESVNLRQ